ncbi:unnamed protein product [Chrysoparadoxa australica]
MESQAAATEGERPPIGTAECDKIFGNVGQLLGFNRQFLADLEAAQCSKQTAGAGTGAPNGKEDGDVATSTDASGASGEDRAGQDKHHEMLDVIVKAAPFFVMYSAYIKNHQQATALLSVLTSQKPLFRAFTFACEAQKACHGLRLRDFLIMPVQRIPRYKLLLETMIKFSEEGDPLAPRLGEGLKSISMSADRINHDVHKREAQEKLLKLQVEFKDNFVAASRTFVREGILQRIGKGGSRPCKLLLFSDILVCGEETKSVMGIIAGRREYKTKRTISLERCFVVDAPGQTPAGCPLGPTKFLIIADAKSFVVAAGSPIEKDSWVQAIRDVMGDLMQKRKSRLEARLATSPRSSASLSKQSDRNLAIWVLGKDGKTQRQAYVLPASVQGEGCGVLRYDDLAPGKVDLQHRFSLESEASLSDLGLASMGMGMGMAPTVGPGGATGDRESYGSQASSNFTVASSIALGSAAGAAAATGARPESSDSMGLITGRLEITVTLDPGDIKKGIGLRLRDISSKPGGVIVVGFARLQTPAAREGILIGDQIKAINGIDVCNAAEVASAIKTEMASSVAEDACDVVTPQAKSFKFSLLRGFMDSSSLSLSDMMAPPPPPPEAAATVPQIDDAANTGVSYSSTTGLRAEEAPLPPAPTRLPPPPPPLSEG